MTLASLTDTLPFGVHWPLCAWLIDFLTLSACGSLGCKRYTVLVTHLFLSIHFPVRVLAEARDQDMWRYTDTNRDMYNPHQPTHRHLPSLYISTHMHSNTLAPKSPVSRVSFRPLRTDQAQLWLERSWGSGGVSLSRLWESPALGHRSLPAALAVWKVMGHSLTTMHRQDRVSKGGWGQREAQIYRYWTEPRPSAWGNYTEYEHARWGLAAIFHFHPEPL